MFDETIFECGLFVVLVSMHDDAKVSDDKHVLRLEGWRLKFDAVERRVGIWRMRGHHVEDWYGSLVLRIT